MGNLDLYLASCAYCGWHFCRKNLFCASCWNLVLSQLNSAQLLAQDHYVLPFPVFALMKWTQNNDRLARSLIYAMKGGKQKEAAFWLCERFIFAKNPSFKPFLVPAPARNGRDHALVLAEAFGDILGLPIQPVLRRVSMLEQKKLTRKDRQGLRMERVADIPPLNSTHFVLVDDLITTGNTARAAFEALGKPQQFEIWALACRDQLAPFEAFCYDI